MAGANSLETIITHLVGSESETLRCAADLPSERDRESEFEGKKITKAECLRCLTARTPSSKTEPRIDATRLQSFALPTPPAEQVRSGLTWLVGNFGDGCDHVGHIQLTKQLYLAKAGS